MQKRPPRTLAIHDLSGFGRCSLSVILPVLSGLGVQVCPVPTAILSTHTGGLGEVELWDLSGYIRPTLEHYKRLALDFECVYSGFLSNEGQIDHCLECLGSYPGALHVVDPVMGDYGKPYRTITPQMQKRMGELVRAADVVTPNLTEAYILLGREYVHEPLTVSAAKSLLARLSELGPSSVVVTGVELVSGGLCNIGYDRDRSAFWRLDCDYVPVSYPGTGDLFCSVLTGGLLTGDSLPLAMDRATRFVELTIKTTYSYGSDPRYGVMLEKTLGWLTQSHVLGDYQAL